MGTSVSQYSPRKSKKWNPVHVCYKNDNIPEDRVLTEVWRAADNPSEQVQWSNEMKSDVIYSCFEMVKSSSNIQEAMSKFRENILANQNNSIVAELAKRSIPVAFQGSTPANDWVNKFFSEVTNYVVSGYSAHFFTKDSTMWESELKFPIIQDYIANFYGVELSEIEVGVFGTDTQKLSQLTFSDQEVTDAKNELDTIGHTISRII